MTVLFNCDFPSFNDWSASSTPQSMQHVIRWNSGAAQDQEMVIDWFLAKGDQFVIYNETSSVNEVGDNYFWSTGSTTSIRIVLFGQSGSQ